MGIEQDNTEIREVDVIVIGAGPAGMTAAIVAHAQGLSTLLLEKTDQVGGTAAWSAGMMWFVDTKPMHDAGFADSLGSAKRYFDEMVGSVAPASLQNSYIEHGRAALEYMLAHSELRVVATPYPDYYPVERGAGFGRAHAPLDFDGRTLGRSFKTLRGPLSQYAPFGGMMLNFDDIMHFMSVTHSVKSAWHIVKLLARHGIDRLSHHRGTRLVNGNALVGRLYKTVLDRKIPVWLNTAPDTLLVENDRVVGLTAAQDGKIANIRARRGVIIATGGYPASREMRQANSRDRAVERSIALPGNVGDGITLATAIGGRLDRNATDTSYYVPLSLVPTPRGDPLLWGHWGLDRAKPGFIAVDLHGRRFTNEAASYHEFVLRMFDAGTPACWLVADARAVKRYGIGAVLPGGIGLSRLLRNGYVQTGRTLGELAGRIGMDATPLEATVARFNSFADTGVDADFGKGSFAYDRFFADPAHAPNMCIAPLTQPPFYAVKMVPGDFGTSRGVVTGANGEVLGPDDQPIPGLFACGNDMNSPTAGQYLGAGITLGPAITFGYLAASALARGKADQPILPRNPQLCADPGQGALAEPVVDNGFH